MSNSNLSKYSAKIKDVYIELKGYDFFHSPFYKDENPDKQKADCSKRFIGREKIIKRIQSILKNTNIKSGAYLITGFRGMGKTSVIREAIFNHNFESNKNKFNISNIYFFFKDIISIVGTIILIRYLFFFSSSCKLIQLFDFFFWVGLASILVLKTITLLIFKKNKFVKTNLWKILKVFLIVLSFLIFGIRIYISDSLNFNGMIKPLDFSEKLIFLNSFEEISFFKIFVSLLLSTTLVITFLLIWDTFFFIIKEFLILVKKIPKKIELTSKYERFEINLSQEGLNEVDVLRRISINVREYWLDNRNAFNNFEYDRKIYSLGKFILSKTQQSNKLDIYPTYDSILNKLNTLINRMSGQVTSQKEVSLNSNVSTRSNFFANFSFPFGTYSDRKEISYAVASSKEIEDYLIEIFKDIDSFRDKNTNFEVRQFVFIIDELDKVEPLSTISWEEKESSNPKLDYNSLNNNKYRKRQEAVATLLANLKGFLNVVRVKFFFIGGREMYDAYLADIADRDSFYSSIFNDVIYVESFFKDSLESSTGKGGVTQMTEQYLCNIILNDLKNGDLQDLNSKNPNMKDLFRRLKLTYVGDSKNHNNPDKPLESDELVFVKNNKGGNFKNATDESRKKAAKVISTLQSYIIYLTYRSNGTPKKITSIVEKIIINGPNLKDVNEEKEFYENNLVVVHERSKNKKLYERLFLKFNFDLQYEIGLTSSLYRPYLISNSRHLKSLGDKLLFSSSFIIDHIFKFHPFGFSWRNLELIPEVVLINREPNLRKFIEDLMRFYSNNYIKDTVSGIFDYRFRSIVRRELVFLSKTSDLSSAAFNFTLDESLSTKRHYVSRLSELEQSYKRYKPIESDNQFVHSISFIQTILGDLHFYDKEYDEAVVYYSDSIQSLRFPTAISEKLITRHQFLLWLRNQLKLGLTLEKMRAFDSAFSLYKTLIIDAEKYLNKVIGKNVDEEEVKKASNIKIDLSEEHRTMHLISMPFVAILAVMEKSRVDGITYASLRRNREDFKRIISLENKDVPDRNVIIFDGYRRNFLNADYYNNVGSLLFYKNCQFPKFFNQENDKYILESFIINNNQILAQQQIVYNKYSKEREYDFYPSLASFNYYWNSIYFITKEHRKRIVNKINKRSGLKSYKKEIDLEENLLAISAGLLLPECIDMISSKRMYYLASVISKIGDSILASLRNKDFVIPKIKFNILDVSDNYSSEKTSRCFNIYKFRELVGDNLYSIETVLHTYKLAAALFKRAGHNSYYATHLIRILYTIKDLIALNKKEKEFENNIWLFLGIDINSDYENKFLKLEEVAETVFRVTSWNNEIANRPQLLKYREILGIIENKNIGRDILYNNLSNISDNREVLILVEEIKMKLYKDNYADKDYYKKNLINFKLSKSLISPYGSVNSRYLRMLELKYRTERCYFIMKEILEIKDFFNMQPNLEEQKDESRIKKRLSELLENEKKNTTIGNIIEFLIKEAFFCLSELIKMFKIYDPGYVIGYSFIAVAYERMGDWCNVYENYKTLYKASKRPDIDNYGIDKEVIKKIKENQDIELDIKKILSSETLANIDARNYYESSIQYYYKVIQMHSDSKSYSDKSHEIYMLEDDYNDISAHYVIASERVRANTGSVKRRIQKIKKHLEDNKSKLYTYASYLPHEDEDNDNKFIENNLVNIYKYLELMNKKVIELKDK
ncbi:hypothetical protein EZY14_009630 [Kordia sp. TARA_039_SRF]|nr:hypothetical protein EZY14_009630 [Kordia sp. TARA_039_SRF]